MEPIENLYFNWLCAKVVYLEVKSPSLTRDHLLRQLYRTEFIWVVPHDEHRVKDGLALRDEFLKAARVDSSDDWLRLGCSVLEMLIAFSRRLEFDSDIPAEQWFWQMLENLKIGNCSDALYLQEEVEPFVEDILYDFIWREYDRNGRGSLFPMFEANKDHRDLEIWYQYCAYWEEHNYTI